MMLFVDYDTFRKSHIDKVIYKKENALILDIGCGDGRLFREYRVIGIDVNGEILKKNPNPTIKMNITKKRLPFKNNTVDQIFCLEVLEHLQRIEDVIKVLKEFYRVLKPKGLLIIHTPNRGRLNLIIRKILGKPKKYPFLHATWHYWEFTKEELKKLLIDCGFKPTIYAGYLNFPFISKWGIPIKTSLGRTLIVEAVKI